MNHHHCQCKHTRLRYCAACQRPYCLDCGTEWYSSAWTYYPYYYTYSNTYTPMDGSTYTTADCNTGCAHANAADAALGSTAS